MYQYQLVTDTESTVQAVPQTRKRLNVGRMAVSAAKNGYEKRRVLNGQRK